MTLRCLLTIAQPDEKPRAIGASIDLKPDDTIVSSRGNFTVRIATGETLKFLLKEAAVNGSSEKQGPVVSCRGGAARVELFRIHRRSIQSRHRRRAGT